MKTAILLVASILLSAVNASPFSQPRTFVEEVADDVHVRDENYRLLPQKITISRYDVKLTPYFSGINAFTFDGEVTITAKASEANVSELKLHAKMLKIHSVMHGTDNLAVNPIDDKYDFWIIKFTTAPPANVDFKIVIKYTGVLGDDMHGFYRSSYEEYETEGSKKVVTKWMGTTQFQPVHARRAFPCFDEPGYKAVFQITIRRPKSFQPSLSNTLIKSISETDDYVEEIFNDTPIMPAYLIAFIVSEYKPAELVAANTVNQYGIWARPDAEKQGSYAVITAQKLVKTLGDYVNYNFSKMGTFLKNDHVAIPDFSAGAMENWGLATYREAYLMYHPNETSVRYQQQIASILSHEIAHFWFGDLVTCKWWSETWLNEGFARYFQYFLTDWMEDPDKSLDMTSQFTVAQVQSVMGVDASNTSTPMTNKNTNSPAEVQAQFGTVTYNKGASVIRMVRNWLSEDTFQKALKSYMSVNEYNVVEEDKLFEELQKAADADGTISAHATTVKELMSSWTDYNGYPVLKVNVDRKDDGSDVYIEQVRFMKSDQIYSESDRLWNIPITYTTKTESNFDETIVKFILKGKNMTLTDKIAAKDWIIFNIKQGGFYRVMYDNETLKLIIEDLNTDGNKINTFNKAQIVDDLFNFAREGMMDYRHMLESTMFLEMTDEYAPWSAAFAGFSFLRSRFATVPSVHRLIELHMLTMMQKTLLANIPLEEDDKESHLFKLFRINTYNIACQLGSKDCRNRSIEIFKEFKNNGKHIKPNIREFIYCTALRNGGEDDFDILWDKYLTENVINEKIVILNALGCSLKENRLEKLLLNTLYQDSPIRDQDKMAAFNSVLNGNAENLNVAFNFVKANVKTIKTSYGSGNLRSMIDSIATRMTADELKTLDDFLGSNMYLEAADVTSGKRSIEMAESSLEWVKDKSKEIEDYLGDLYNSAGTLGASVTLMVIMLVATFMNN